ncbi:MAG: hypothetical protein LBQ30_09990, partial [Treponema sp.]|nr:hypothetical protein [Treponema sp.]
MVKQIKLRTDTEANFIAANTLLRNGELGIAICTDSTRKIKVGNGYTPWVDLPYTADMDKYDDILAGITEENENQETSLEHLEQALAELETDVAGIVEQQNQQGETLSALQNQETVQDDALRETIQVVSNHDGRLENLETQVASLEELPLTGETVLEIQQKDAEQDDRLDGIDGTLTEITQNIAQNQQKNTDQDADIQGLAESVSAFSEKILSFESAQGGYNNQFSTLAAKETEQDNRLSNLEAATASSSGASSDHTSRIDTLFDNLEAEIAARDGADREHDQAITDLTETYTQERIDRIDGDDALTQAVTELNEKIDQETAERTQAD